MISPSFALLSITSVPFEPIPVITFFSDTSTLIPETTPPYSSVTIIGTLIYFYFHLTVVNIFRHIAHLNTFNVALNTCLPKCRIYCYRLIWHGKDVSSPLFETSISAPFVPAVTLIVSTSKVFIKRCCGYCYNIVFRCLSLSTVTVPFKGIIAGLSLHIAVLFLQKQFLYM